MTATASHAASPDLPDWIARGIVTEWKEPILVLDQNLLMEFANRSFCDWVGIRWEKMRGQRLEEFLVSPDASDYLREVQRGSMVRDIQVKCEISGIGKRSVLLTAKLLQSSTPQAMFLGIVDTTNMNLSDGALARKVEMAERSEKWLQKETDLLRSIMESSGDGIFVADAGGRCVLWNPACERLLGFAPDAIEQGEWTERIGVYMPDKITPYPVDDLPLSRALRGESCNEVELWVRNEYCPEGRWISVTARPLTDGRDGAVSTFRDVTFDKNARMNMAELTDEIARSNRELEQFAYVAAHDLQEPLRMVSSYVQLLSRRYKGKLDADADEFIGFAIDGAKRMSLLINDLLTYSRIGRSEVDEKVVDCEKVLRQVLCTLGQKNETARAEITHDPLPQINANELQITQIFQNLIDNAVKFRSKERPKVHISAHEEEGRWIFSVADNGIGIEAAHRERVFVIFQRLNSREDYDGTGIGLSVVKRIVEKHDGKIWVEPNQGSGTIVYFTWP